MSQNFIIVIEADNKRASAAYQKGLSDIERLWPQIEAYATAKDAERNEEYKREMQIYEEDSKKYREAERSYYDELEAWRNSSSWRKGERPVRPEFVSLWPPHMPYSIFNHYCSVKADLKHMADVAGAAVGPFRMTEHQVKEMVSWEDGSVIDRIKNKIAGGAE